jgi:uncharacterized protein (TIGR02271 family)
VASTKQVQGATTVGVFDSREAAERAVSDLKAAGYRDDQISLVAKDATGGTVRSDGSGNDMASNAASGAATGAAVGAGAAGLVSLGISFGVIPVIGPILAMGPLAAALLSAAGGAAAAGLAGALIGAGLTDEDARFYEGEVHAGRYLVTVTGEARGADTRGVITRHGGYDRATAATRSTTGAGQTMRVHEEKLHATTTPVQTGEVRVHKEVHTENQTINVPVTREEVVIERRPASGQASTSDLRPGEEIRIPVKEEKVHVHKEAVVKEEVSVGKRKVTENEQVSGTVRKEEVRVEKEGDVDVQERKKK